MLNQGVTSTFDIGDGEEVSIAQRDAVNRGREQSRRPGEILAEVQQQEQSAPPVGRGSNTPTRSPPESPAADAKPVRAKLYQPAGCCEMNVI